VLDAETKAKIDSARDILVGKVPDPKSQVEQITIALIYKFMDDMDRQSEELGGKATFFLANSRNTAGPTCSTSGLEVTNACFSMPKASRR
jgi:type I restriction enzyme M protein